MKHWFCFICFINSTYIKLYQKLLKGHGLFLYNRSQKMSPKSRVQDVETAVSLFVFSICCFLCGFAGTYRRSRKKRERKTNISNSHGFTSQSDSTHLGSSIDYTNKNHTEEHARHASDTVRVESERRSASTCRRTEHSRQDVDIKYWQRTWNLPKYFAGCGCVKTWRRLR